jgi:hypothetical protein
MSNGDRTGPLGEGSKTGRSLGYCTGSDTPGYTKGVHSGTGRKYRHGVGRGTGHGMGRVTGRGFRCRDKCRKAPFSGSLGAFAAQGVYPRDYHSASSQAQGGSEADFLENRINLLKRELETLSGKFKALRLQGNSGKE